MKQMLMELRSAFLATVVLAVIGCGLYPLLVFGVGQLAFRDKANGSLIVDKHGAVRGSQRLGQAFTNAAYFHARPSAAGNGYDAANSSGSNLGPTSRKLRDTIRERIKAYRGENGLKETDPIPADTVTASGSGLDPDISPESARMQTARVAAARGLSLAAVSNLIDRSVEGPQLGILGEDRINVLGLNMALDAMDNAR